MRRRLESIYPAAWTIRTLPPEWGNVHVLCMPKPILDFLNRLPVQHKDAVLPFVSLNDLLTASSSIMIGFNPNPQYTLAEHPERPWLYALSQQIDIDRLKNLMTLWVRSLWDERYADAFLQAWGEGHWVWQKADLQKATNRLKRRLLPGLITRWLLSQGYSMVLSEQHHALKAVAATEHAETAELMTEPKRYSSDHPENNTQSYSYVLRFSVLDTPEANALTFAHRLVVRRWLNKRPYIKYGGKRSVYLRWAPGYLDKKRHENVYGRVKISYVGGKQPVIWIGNQARVFGDLPQAQVTFPPAEVFLNDPSAHHETCLVPATTSDFENEVGTGVSHNDQYEAFKGLTEQFVGFAEPFERCKRVTIANLKTPVKERNQSFFNPNLALTPRLAIPAKTLWVELHTDRAEHIESLILEALDGDEAQVTRRGDILSIPVGEGGQTLNVVRYRDSELIAPLKDGGRKGRSPTVSDNTERIRHIVKAYPKRNDPTMALIELSAYHNDQNMKHRDPKQAIRDGLIKTGRVAKFFTPPDGAVDGKIFKNRLKSAVSAILRGLGCRVQPFYIPQEETGLPTDLDILGFWMIRLNRRQGHMKDKAVTLPVLVKAGSNDLHLQLYLPDGSGDVAHYPTLYDALLGVYETEVAFDAENRADMVRFFRSALELWGRKTPALLVLDEQNLRRVFTDLNDHQAAAVELEGVLAEFPQVRVARLQYSLYHEAPMCLPGQSKSKYSGLYGHAGNSALFYSLHDVGHQRPRSDERKEDDPSQTLNSVGTVQVWMNNLHAGDNPAAWAAVVHQLRVASNHIDFATRIPQPLHDVISWLPKYLLRYEVISDTELDDWDEIVEE